MIDAESAFQAWKKRGMDPFKVPLRECKTCYEFRPMFEFVVLDGYRRHECDDCRKIRKAKYAKGWKLQNKERWNKYTRDRRKIPHHKIAANLRNRLYFEIKNCEGKRSTSAFDLLGCSIEFFMEYLEDQFQKGMSWDNWTTHGWHIDHIIPCAAFDLTNEQQQRECFHYTNLQPLWAKENWKKGSSLYFGEHVTAYKTKEKRN
jgi:hypothetical protein